MSLPPQFLPHSGARHAARRGHASSKLEREPAAFDAVQRKTIPARPHRGAAAMKSNHSCAPTPGDQTQVNG
jgi:hypothetical protein